MKYYFFLFKEPKHQIKNAIRLPPHPKGGGYFDIGENGVSGIFVRARSRTNAAKILLDFCKKNKITILPVAADFFEFCQIQNRLRVIARAIYRAIGLLGQSGMKAKDIQGLKKELSRLIGQQKKWLTDFEEAMSILKEYEHTNKYSDFINLISRLDKLGVLP